MAESQMLGTAGEWTEDDIMCYGLAGEDEYVEMVADVSSAEECGQTPAAAQLASPRTSATDVTKSGRVRIAFNHFIFCVRTVYLVFFYILCPVKCPVFL
jgi:hypothetical protein